MATKKERSAAAKMLGALGGTVVTKKKLASLVRARAAKAAKKKAKEGKR